MYLNVNRQISGKMFQSNLQFALKWDYFTSNEWESRKAYLLLTLELILCLIIPL